MTNNNKNNKKNKTSLGRQGNPVSFTPSIARSQPLTRNQRVFEGKDLIVTSVSGITTFGVSDYFINPRLPAFFPGASLIAQRYDMYQFDSLEFRWHPTSAVTTTPGVVFLAWEPNSNHADLNSTISTINAMEHHVECPVYRPDCSLRIPKQVLGQPRYLRSGPIMGDMNLYDTGRLLVAVGACADTNEKGYVEVHYKIRFFNYHLEEPSLIQNRVAEIARISTGQTLATGVTSTLEFNSTLQDFGGWDDALDLTSGVLTLPRGIYQVTAQIGLLDDANEALSSTVELYQNGSAFTVPVTSFMIQPASGSTNRAYHNFIAVVESDGTDTIEVKGTMTGAAGNLTFRPGSRLLLTALS